MDDLADFFYRLSYRYCAVALERQKQFLKSNSLIVDLSHCLTWAPTTPRTTSGWPGCCADGSKTAPTRPAPCCPPRPGWPKHTPYPRPRHGTR